jgi:hypothetical protein
MTPADAIVRYSDEDPRALVAHPANPNVGNVAAIVASLKAHGQYKPVVVNQRSGFLVAGHHTVRAAIEAGFTSVAVAWIDVERDEELRILLADNATGRGSRDDDGKLRSILEELEATTRGFEGTGYSASSLDELREVASALEEAEGPPPFKLPTASVLDLTGAWASRLARAWGRRWKGAAKWGPVDTTRAPLYEAVLRWFSAPGDGVLELYSGSAAGGLVASALDRRYLGLDLRRGRVMAAALARGAAHSALGPHEPEWREADATTVAGLAEARTLLPALVVARIPDGQESRGESLAEIGHRPVDQRRPSVMLALRGAVDVMAPVGFVVVVVPTLGECDVVAQALRPKGLVMVAEGVVVEGHKALLRHQWGLSRALSRAHAHVLVWARGGVGPDGAYLAASRLGPTPVEDEADFIDEDLPDWAR